MFFTASKIFWAMAQPVSLVFLLIVLALVLMRLRRPRLGTSFGVLAAVILGLCCFTTVGSLMIQPLENRFARPGEMPAEVGTIVLLGGSTSGQVSQARQVVEANAAGDRLLEVLRLARLYPQAKIIASGGSGQLITQGESEAETARRLFEGMGIDMGRVVLEGQSRNTAENAALSRTLVGDGAMLLVTSGSHMPRSMGLFRKEGLDPIAWPVDYRSTGSEGSGVDFSDPLDNLQTVTTAVREWIGLAAYYATGQIDTLFPAP